MFSSLSLSHTFFLKRRREREEEERRKSRESSFNLRLYSSIKLSLNSFLSVKKWLLRKKHQIELARKRGWKGYWVCLKGTTLLFYPCDSREGRSVEAAPKHLIIVDGAIMQPIPEHPKRDYIFCLSTAFGDAYLFQAPCQVSRFTRTFLCDLFLNTARHFSHPPPSFFLTPTYSSSYLIFSLHPPQQPP
jgi:PH domain